jgi:hypothetical protein
MRHDQTMRAVLRGVIWSPDPRRLPADPAEFAFGAHLLVGPADGEGTESFDPTACSPEWLSRQCKSGEPITCLHHVVVGYDAFDERALQRWLAARVHAAEGDSRRDIAARLSLLGSCEFDQYRR